MKYNLKYYGLDSWWSRYLGLTILVSLQLISYQYHDKTVQTFLSHRHSKHMRCKYKSTFPRVHCMHNFILFAFLFENIRIRFDGSSNDRFLARKNVKKTTSFSLFWKAEMIHSEPIRIHRRQYKYLEDRFRGTNK